ncbi:MAG: hypothetical protein IPG71_12550 [bacterium]|nr:hypothetical protein [bacterium]
MTQRTLIALLCCLCLNSSASAQAYDTLRVATYNLLNYPGSTSNTRNPEFRKILRTVDPDVIIVQEMLSSAGVAEFLDEVLNFVQPGTYENAPFSNGPDTDNALYYKPSRVTYISQVVVATALRDINGYVLRPAGIMSDTLDFRVYSGHLKASQGEEAARLAEAQILRSHLNALGPGHYIFGGDFNLYTSTEDAYVELIGSQADNDGRLYDVLNQPGSWHNSATYAAIHTQSPRLGNLGDGGATGGMDDRFDFLLPTYAFQTLPSWQVVPGSYTTFGNDGAHFQESINTGTNFAVPDSIADALYLSSDHIPVFLDIMRQVTAQPSVTLTAPNGGQSFGTGDTMNVTWNTANYTGNVSLSLSRSGSGGPWETLATGTLNDGTFKWVASGSATAAARARIVLDGSPSTSDLSDADFTIFQRELAVFTPSTGSSFIIGNNVGVNWTASGFAGDVRIELKRAPSSGSWELLAAATPNSGSFGWIAAGNATDSALIRVSSVSTPALADSSGMFHLVLPTLTLTRPNGGETFVAGATEAIQWTHTNLSGFLTLEVNRTYPTGAWELIATNVNAAGGTYSWPVSGPGTTSARVRVRSLSLAQIADTSNALFDIVVNNQAPAIGHSPVCDGASGPVTFFCTVTDDGVYSPPVLKWSADGFATTDSITLAILSAGKYGATPLFAEGFYDYFLSVTDAGALTSRTDTFGLTVAPECGLSVSYDDGSAELYQWSPDTGFAWAVRFTPPTVPFVLCATEWAMSSHKPDTLHDLVHVTVYSADGVGGLPGTALGQFEAGALPNSVTGSYDSSPLWGKAILMEAGQQALTVNSDFYVSVEADCTAWALDNSSPTAGHSFLWDPCEAMWLQENGAIDNTRNGNRMLRVIGWSMTPPELTIGVSGSDAVLRWSSTGAPRYTVFRATNPLGPFDVPIAEVEGTNYTDAGVLGSLPTAFYLVRSSQ